MKLGHSEEDCIVETGCKNWQVKPKKPINYSIDFGIDVINAEEVVSKLVNGEIEFRRGSAASLISNLEEETQSPQETP